MAGYELNSDNPGWVKGWGVYRNAPWHFASLFPTREEADAHRLSLGPGYQVHFGSRELATDNFIVES